MTPPTEKIAISLGDVPATDAFNLDIEIDGMAVLHSVAAAGPGLFRTLQAPPEGLIPAGWTVGFLQRGPLLIPVSMPQPGWLLASVQDGARVEHGTPVLRILLTHEGIIP